MFFIIEDSRPKFFIKIGGKKYYLTTKNITTWQSARTECQNLKNGDLATVGIRNDTTRK